MHSPTSTASTSTSSSAPITSTSPDDTILTCNSGLIDEPYDSNSAHLPQSFVPIQAAGMSIWRYGAKMSATRIFLAPVRKKPALEIRSGSGRPASSGYARPPSFTARVFTHTCIIKKKKFIGKTKVRVRSGRT